MTKSPAPLRSDRATDLRDHGIAVRCGSPRSVLPWRDPNTGRDYVYLGVNYAVSSGMLLQVDVATGRCRQFNFPKGCSGPWSMATTMEGHLLITSVGGQLIRFDPVSGKIWVAADTKYWLWTVARGADGRFYLGNRMAKIFRYDAQTNEVVEVASFDHLNPGANQSVRHLVAGEDGYIYGNVGFTTAHCVAYHIGSGTAKDLLPRSEVGPNTHQIGRGADGRIYTRTVHGNVYRLEHGHAFLVVKGEGKPGAAPWCGFARPAGMPDGRSVTLLDPDAIRIGDGPDAKVIPLRYTGDPVPIFHLAAGPLDAVYASTIMPLYLIRYTPATRKLENLGRGGPDNGEIYSFGHCDGKLYCATYSGGRLMVYDPVKPWHKDPPGELKWQDNPRLIGDLGENHCRPRAMCVDAKKRVWIGSIGDYGMLHGALACYDIASDKLTNNPVVVPRQSIMSLAADDAGEFIYGGTSVMFGGPKEACIFAWDAGQGKLLWKVPVKGQNGIINLLQVNGKLYGVSRPTFSFFCFDPAKRKMEYFNESKIDCCREQSLTLGPDGNLYGITYRYLFRWHPDTGQIDVLHGLSEKQSAAQPGGSLFHRGAVIVKDRFYFSCGAQVMSMRLPRFA